jgi:hypothetical protein
MTRYGRGRRGAITLALVAFVAAVVVVLVARFAWVAPVINETAGATWAAGAKL